MSSSIDYLLSIESKGIKLGLERTKSLNNSCGSPDKNLKIIQVAGTNGKGSTSAMIAKGLEEVLDKKIGLFTSPHLVNINERIRINGVPIKNSEIEEFISLYKNNIERKSASFFESITIMAFWYFKKHQVDYAIMETGLGGRLDSVTICNPILTVITSISMDHSEILGDTLTKIAKEKAGIIKPNVPCITIDEHPLEIKEVIVSECNQKKAELIISSQKNRINLSPSLLGKAQLQNAGLAQLAVSTLINDSTQYDNICRAIEKTRWHGRNQIIQESPLVIFDVAHNEAGISSFIDFIQSFNCKKKYLILSLQSRKDIKSQAVKLSDIFDEIILCETYNKRTMPIDELKSYFPPNRNIHCIKSDQESIDYAMKNIDTDDLVGIIGTHHLGDAIANFFNITFNLL
tara:strand:- start:63 stop:1271 length:1209 start_codon:yes stop_codon:yes gene_type:complete